MKISCILGTYNRAPTQPHLLAESVESFLRQTHPDKELIIVNDHPSQEIVFEHPQVRVINTTPRFPTLCDKHNFATAFATGEGICEWDDDDISLPHRLAQASAILEAGYEYFNPGGYWFLNSGRMHFDHSIGYCVNAGAWTREVWRRAGGAPRVTQAGDAVWDQRLHAVGAKTWPGPRQGPRDWAYVYRWGVSNWHLSGRADMEQSWRDQEKEATASGRFEIKPCWQADYVALVEGKLRETYGGDGGVQ